MAHEERGGEGRNGGDLKNLPKGFLIRKIRELPCEEKGRKKGSVLRIRTPRKTMSRTPTKNSNPKEQVPGFRRGRRKRKDDAKAQDVKEGRPGKKKLHKPPLSWPQDMETDLMSAEKERTKRERYLCVRKRERKEKKKERGEGAVVQARHREKEERKNS